MQHFISPSLQIILLLVVFKNDRNYNSVLGNYNVMFFKKCKANTALNVETKYNLIKIGFKFVTNKLKLSSLI